MVANFNHRESPLRDLQPHLISAALLQLVAVDMKVIESLYNSVNFK